MLILPGLAQSLQFLCDLQMQFCVAFEFRLDVPRKCIDSGFDIYQSSPTSKEFISMSNHNWDTEWSYLDQETGRFAIVRSFLQLIHPKPRVLDIGCGNGIMLRTCGDVIGRYHGADAAADAVSQIECCDNIQAECCSIDEFKTDQRFDAVVFNEVLYYLPDPLHTVLSSLNLLKKNGVIIISIFQKPGLRSENKKCTKRLFRLINDKSWDILEDSLLSSKKHNASWRIAMVRP